MKRNIFFVTLFLITILGCQKQPESKKKELGDKNIDSTTTHNARNSLDYIGTYVGVLPCADCEGIETKVILNENNTYTLQMQYLGKGKKIFENKGPFHWNKSGSTVILENIKNAPNMFFVMENKLQQLDIDGKKITGELAQAYFLAKQPSSQNAIDTEQDNATKVNMNNRIETKTIIKTVNPAEGKFALAETKWKLIELNRKPIKSKAKKNFYLKLNSKDGRFTAFAGCNSMSGSYVMKSAYSISFSKVISTQMACPDMEIEQDFGVMLSKVDNYTIKNNKLSLNRAKMAPLAQFEAIQDK